MKQLVTLDTDVLIDFQRGDKMAAFELAHLARASALVISAVVQLELLAGSANKELLQSSLRLLRRFQVLPLTPEIGELTTTLITTYSLSNGLRLADALIAAMALVHDAALLSKNQRDFRFIPDLKLLPYPGTPA